jgi:hypothetical protein
MYTIYQNGGKYDQIQDLNTAIDLANEFIGNIDPSEPTTFTVEDNERRVLASVTNRRIIGTFHKQQWELPRQKYAIDCGEEEFDATNDILLMQHESLLYLTDQSEKSDAIGQNHVQWDGPCYVHITESICEYFGVSDIEDITPENLAHARSQFNPKPSTTEYTTITIKLKLNVAAGRDINEFIENLDYSVTSNTVGIIVQDTEIID